MPHSHCILKPDTSANRRFLKIRLTVLPIRLRRIFKKPNDFRCVSGFKLKRLCLAVFILAFSAPPAYADGTREQLQTLETQAAYIKKEQETLAKQQREAESRLKATRVKLVSVATSVRENEALLESLNKQIAELSAEQSGLNDALEDDRLSMARLIAALEKLRRLPPQAMIAKPDAPIEVARSAMLMQDILPTLNRKAQALSEKLEELARVEEELKAKQDKTLITANRLKIEQQDLQDLLKEREKLFAQLDKDLVAKTAKAQKISAQAKSLGDLVARLEDERTRAQKTSLNRSAVPLPKLGQTQLPLRGKILTKYNETDRFGAKSKGVSIQGRSGAMVVAPMGGVVRFAGYFKNYGNMVILEHKNGYHSLIAGMEKIDTVVDQSVLAGEPIGLLNDVGTPSLYFELRHRGKAINPAKKFKLT